MRNINNLNNTSSELGSGITGMGTADVIIRIE